MASTIKWEGGPNFIYAPQWSTGRTNSGQGNKTFGYAGMKRGGTFKFNPNVTPTNHVSCQITQKSKIDKKSHEDSPRNVKRYISKAKGIFNVESQ